MFTISKHFLLFKNYVNIKLGDSMKRSIPLVIIFLILLLLLELGYTVIKKDHVEEYTVDNYNITELYSDGSYYLSIDNGSEYYRYQTDINFNKTTNIVEKILTYNVNNYKCIYPIYKDNSSIRNESKYSDIECSINGTTYAGEALNRLVDLTPFKNTIKENNGNYNTRDNKTTPVKNVGSDSYYLLDLPGVYLISIGRENNHLYVSNKTVGYIEDFPVNITSLNHTGLANNLFIYSSSSSQINKFGYVDLLTGSSGEISSAYNISTNSYACGSYKDGLFIYDLDNHAQYKVTKSRVSESSKSDNTSLYYDGEKDEYVENSKFDSRLLFNETKSGKLSYYTDNNQLYKVYNNDTEHPVVIYRGYSKGIKAEGNYVMFSDNNNIYIHSDTSGVQIFFHSVYNPVQDNKYYLYIR